MTGAAHHSGHGHVPALLDRRYRRQEAQVSEPSKYRELLKRLDDPMPHRAHAPAPVEKRAAPAGIDAATRALLEEHLEKAFGPQSEIARRIEELQDHRPVAPVLGLRKREGH